MSANLLKSFKQEPSAIPPKLLERVLLAKVGELDALFEDPEVRAAVAGFGTSNLLVALPKSSSTYCTQARGAWHYDSQTRWMPGWTIGAGLEHMLADHWLLRLEYRYADFGQANPTFFAPNLGANGDDRVFAHVWVKTHTVSLGAAYKF